MDEAPATFYCIPHTHWEGAVFKTREQYLEIGLPHILKVLKLLKQYPDYRFTLDQACYVKPFIERYPEEVPAFRKFVAEGRLAIVGGTHVMLDGNMPGGESFVRQILYGKGYFRRELGLEVTSGWQIDTFGHHAQMPQLLRLAGYESFWFFRGAASWEVPGEFIWEGIDGSRIPAFWLAQTYLNLHGTPRTLPEFTDFARQRWEQLAPLDRGAGRVGMTAADVSEPEEHLPIMLREFNRQSDRPFSMRFAVPAEFEAAAAQLPHRPVIAGELNPIFQGTYSSRIELKQRTRELESLLTTAEKLGVVLHTLRGAVAPTDGDALCQAWEPMLFNQAHDLMSGVMTDAVYDDTLRGYDFSRRIAAQQVEARLKSLTASVDTQRASASSAAAIPLIVFNPMGWLRTDAVEATVGFSTPGVRGVKVMGPDGEEVPAQILEATRCTDGTLVHAKLAFIAKGVPALGYAVWRVLPDAEPPVALSARESSGECVWLSNEFYNLSIDSGTGAIVELIVNDGGWNALSGPANVVAMEEDLGDFWEVYKPLDGGSRVAMTDRHEPPAPGHAVFSTDQRAETASVTRGPVLSEVAVAHPLGTEGRFETRIRLYAGLPRIDICTRILNNSSRVRYRMLVPTSLPDGESTHEIPFGAIKRPDGIEFPAQNWVDWANRDKGVVLLNRGLPGNNVSGGTLMLSLMRSTSIVAYATGGGYEPGMGSESGLELGRELAFDYALVPHSGGWRDALAWREGQGFNQPLLARTAAAHPGRLPELWGFLEITHPNVVVSALKPSAEGRVVLRLYEAAGVATRGVGIKLPVEIVSAQELSLLEDVTGPEMLTGGSLVLDFGPFEVKTMGLDLRER